MVCNRCQYCKENYLPLYKPTLCTRQDCPFRDEYDKEMKQGIWKENKEK